MNQLPIAMSYNLAWGNKTKILAKYNFNPYYNNSGDSTINISYIGCIIIPCIAKRIQNGLCMHRSEKLQIGSELTIVHNVLVIASSLWNI